jgi:chemotaxis protein MotB
MAASGGGSWKVAYADFVTAMMAFFLVMWIMSLNQQIKESVAHYFSDPYGATDANGKSGGSETTGPMLNPQPTQRVSMRPGIIKEFYATQFELGATIYFQAGVAELDDEGRVALDELASYILGQDRLVVIRGHAAPRRARDEADNGPREDSWSLACARTMQVRRYLEECGIDPARMRLSQSGEFEPAVPSTESKWQQDNDRVEVFVPKQSAAGQTSLLDQAI